MKKTFHDTVNLASGHSLILGNLPDKLDFKAISDTLLSHDMNLEKFGLFDVATPNFSNYYPEVTADDLKPTENEFVYPVFRALSEVIVHKQFNPIDFSEAGVLKDSMHLLIGQTVYANHEMAVGNELGTVADAFWQKSYKASDSTEIPAGINIKMAIDGKSNPKIARGLMMDPPSVHSNSVTVSFDWQKSHELEDNEFWAKLGTFAADGKMIRRVVTKVKKYFETSLVSHGADPFAQILDKNGKIVNPTYANVTYNSETGKKPIVHFNYKTDLTSLKEETIPEPIINNNSVMDKTLLLIATLFGYTTESLTEDKHTELVDKIKAAQGITNTVTELNQKITDLTTQLSTKDTELATSQNKVTELTTKLGEAENNSLGLSDMRAEAIKLHTLYNGGQPDASVATLVAGSNYDAVKVLVDQYQKLADEKFPLECQSCHSKDVKRQSSVSNTGEGANNKPKVTKSLNDVMAEVKGENSFHSRPKTTEEV